MYDNNLENEFIIKRNDTLPVMVVKLKTRGCMNQVLPFNLSAVTAATFSMKSECGDLTISSQTADIVDSDYGVIQYAWQAGDTTDEGRYNGEFELFFNNGKKMTVPRMDEIKIRIMSDINNS